MRSMTGFALTPQQITDYINHTSGTSEWGYRYRLLDFDLTPISVPGGDNPNDPADITRWITGSTVSMDTTQATHRTMQLTMRPIAGVQINTLRHLVQVWVQAYQNGAVAFEVPIATLSFVLPTATYQDSGALWQVQMQDGTAWIAQCAFQNTYVVPAGTNVISAVRTLLQLDYLNGQTPAGMPCPGPSIPATRINIPPDSRQTAVSMTFTSTDNILSAVNQLLASINYYPLWSDEVGTFCSAPMPYYSGSPPTIAYSYHTDNASIILPAVQQQVTDQANIANVIKVTSSPPSGTPMIAVYTNDSPTSAVSRTNLKRAIVRIVQDDSLPTQDTVNTRAALEGQSAAMATEQLTFTTMLNPFHQVHDVIDVEVRNADGLIEIAGNGGYGFEEISWSMDLAARTMTHTVQRVVLV